jgi:hypothetical protein
MKNIIKLLSLVFVLSLTTVACNENKACKEDCKKECGAKKDKTCEPGCEKECCKGEVDEAMPADSTTEVAGDEQAHMCTEECQSDPHSCPNHSHDDH